MEADVLRFSSQCVFMEMDRYKRWWEVREAGWMAKP